VQLLAGSCSCHPRVLNTAPPGLQPRLVQLYRVSVQFEPDFACRAVLCLLLMAFAEDIAPRRPAVQQLADAQLHSESRCKQLAKAKGAVGSEPKMHCP